MEWVFGTVIVVMLGLFFWASRTANREARKRVQPIIDDVFGMRPHEADRDKKT